MNSKILIIDDEEDIRGLIKGILEDEGYDVIAAATSDRALSLINSDHPDLVIQDIWLQNSDKDGIDILKETKARYPNLPFLMISGHGTIETAVSAIKFGAYDFIEKPFKTDRLILMINRALENAALKKQNEELKQRSSKNIADLVKQLPEPIFNIIDKSAATNSRLLIAGEAGSGKNIAAQYVHEKSARAHNPFMTLNCATTHPETLAQELFGIQAKSEKTPSAPGLLQLVNGGTLLLDEVTSLPLDVQGKILSLLQDGTYYQIGSNDKRSVDIRIIATTSDNIETKIEDGDFREDLFYRLNVVPVHIPPLRKRRSDIAELIQNFSNLTFTERALVKLKSYAWPGNIKQFNNVLEWISIMYGDKDMEIDVSDLPQEITGNPDKASNANDAQDNNGSLFSDAILMMRLREARECFERHYLLSQVNKFDGNISKTAEFIGMERSALHRKLKSLEVFPDEKQNVA
tara:strand:+ start:1191 stop:2576 length:1386 start_codon:yes stop_codon:yes gene_type:complete